jgi:hypothetical protein
MLNVCCSISSVVIIRCLLAGFLTYRHKICRKLCRVGVLCIMIVYVFSVANLFLCVLSACEYAVEYMTYIQCTLSTVFRAILLLSLLQEHCVLRFKLLISSKFFEKSKKYIEVQGIPILQAVKWGMYVQNTNSDIV